MPTYTVLVEGKTPLDEQVAGGVMMVLTEAYPGHPWHVDVHDGLLVIKHMKMSRKWGMVRKLPKVGHDAKVLKHEVVMAAGEFLERAGLARGGMGDEPIKVVEGIPKKDLSLG